MISNLNLIRLLWKTHKWIIIPFVLVQTIALYSLRLYTIYGLNPYSRYSVFEVLALIGLGGLCLIGFYGFTFYLGYLFNRSKSTGWINQLPFSSFAFEYLPILLIVSYGAIVYVTLPWGSFNTGVSLLTFILPVTSFVILKNSRNYAVGLGKVMLIAIGMFLVWFYLFFWWSVFQPKLKVELTFITLCLPTLWFTEKNNKKLAVGTSIILASVFLIELIVIQFRQPLTFQQAVTDVHFWPTNTVIQRFKNFSQEKNKWLNYEQFLQSKYSNMISQLYVEKYLNSEEKLVLFKNIVNNWQEWDGREDNPKNMNKVSLMPQPTLLYGSYVLFPIGPRSINANLERYMYEKWEPERPYCVLLPFRATSAYFDKLFKSSCGEIMLILSSFLNKYNPESKGQYERLVDHYLLTASERANPKVKERLLETIRSQWELRKYIPRSEFYFTQKPITENLLSEWNKEMKSGMREKMKKVLKGSREEVIAKINRLKPKKDEARLLYFLCANITRKCDDLVAPYLGRKISFIESLKQRLIAPGFDFSKINAHVIKKELSKKENWPKIQSLMR